MNRKIRGAVLDVLMLVCLALLVGGTLTMTVLAWIALDTANEAVEAARTAQRAAVEAIR